MRPEHDRTRLPKWAQREIERLEKDLAHAISKLSEGPADSDTFADPYSAAPRPLGRGARIEFKWGDGRPHRNFIVWLDGGRLVVTGGDSISVNPRASNSVEIGMPAK